MSSTPSSNSVLDEAAKKAIELAIGEAESTTTGEIKVYIEPLCKPGDPLVRAREVFALLEMYKTEARNAILVYIALDDKKFALFGDQVIYEKAGGPDFWQRAAMELQTRLRANDLAGGLTNCIKALGEALAAHFPAGPGGNRNELSDEIVFGNNE